MAAIKLDILQPTLDREPSAIYVDLKLDMARDYTTSNELAKQEQIKDIKADYNLGAIRNALINLITTSPGEKILNPIFGINFGDLLFLPVSEERAATIGSAMINNIEKFEPRVKIINLTITPVITDQEYTIDITYNIPRFNNQNLNLKGNLSSSGFYV